MDLTFFNGNYKDSWKEITFTHNTNWWPEREIPENERKWDRFLGDKVIPYLIKICESVGIDADICPTGTMGVCKSNIRFDAYNIFGRDYSLGAISTYLDILNFSSDILGEDRIMWN